MRVIMVGVAGFGGFRRERMRETELFEIVAAYDHSAEALAKCQAEDGARPVPSFEALLETPDVEALVISTGAKFHAEQAIAALERGLHVFVEKPLCATPQEIELLLEAERRTGRVVGCGHVDHSSNNRSLHIKRLLTDGSFGQLATFECTIAHSGGLEIKPGDWRGDAWKNPGGMLFQCGCHGFHELMFYFGPIRRVGSRARPGGHQASATILWLTGPARPGNCTVAPTRCPTNWRPSGEAGVTTVKATLSTSASRPPLRGPRK